MAYARARRMAVSRLYPRCAGRRRGARGLPGVGKQGNKPRRSGYPKISVEPFSSDLTSVAASFRASIPVVRYPTTW